jgi:hypothetical protein
MLLEINPGITGEMSWVGADGPQKILNFFPSFALTQVS